MGRLHRSFVPRTIGLTCRVLALSLFVFVLGCSKKDRSTSPADNASGEFEIDANTVGLWHFNELSGTAVTDAAQFHNDGVAVGTMVTSSGRFGRARYFAQTGGENVGDYVKVHFSDVLDYESAFTVETWFKIDDFEMSIPEGERNVLISCEKVVSLESATGFELGLKRDSSEKDSARFILYFEVAGSDWHGLVWESIYMGLFSTADNGKWHHIAVSMRKHGANGDPDQKFVLDGKDNGWSSEYAGYPNFADVVWLYFGTSSFSFARSQMLRGTIDEVRISNVVRY